MSILKSVDSKPLGEESMRAAKICLAGLGFLAKHNGVRCTNGGLWHLRTTSAILAALLVACSSLAAEPPRIPRIEPDGVSGSLVICGGRTTDPVYDEFVKLAGGEKANIVIIPAASSLADDEDHSRFLVPWKARNV